MSLAHDAAKDWRDIMNDDIGATWSCTVINQIGVERDFTCRQSDISQQIDPGTNQVMTGRQVEISICLSDLDEAGFGDIRAIERSTEKPWKVRMENIIGVENTFKVIETNPDSSIGNMVIRLEQIK